MPGVRLLNNGLTTACLVLLNQLKQSVQKHPKRITAAVATLLLTGGGGAFAVASFAPDPADLPVRTVTQAVQSLACLGVYRYADWTRFGMGGGKTRK